jgi:hypothetical protein
VHLLRLKINGACIDCFAIFVVFSEPNDLQVMQPVLRNVTNFGSPIQISFSEMMGLMTSCQSLETPNLEKRPEAKQISRSARRVPRNLLSNTLNNPIAIFNGIVPGESKIYNSWTQLNIIQKLQVRIPFIDKFIFRH